MNPALVVLLGLSIGLSLAFTVSRLPVFRRPTLADRIAPYLRDQPQIAVRFVPAEPTDGGVRGILASTLGTWGSWLAARLTTDAGLVGRIARSGGAETVERFRAGQILWISCGVVAGALFGTASGISRGFNPVLLVLLIVLGGVSGHLYNDWALSARIRRREERILAEFPTVAELLALSITAGEGTVDALERVCRTTSGALSDELGIALAEARTGVPLVEALDNVGRRTGIRSIVQFVDGVAVAISRGTPLAEVLRAQASDVRDDSKRRLMEMSGRKEVGMLVPVVAFVLPITVLFAVYPSLTVLEISP